MDNQNPSLSAVHLEACSCPNENCEYYGQENKGNIAVRGTYGKDKRPLLYCRICGKRFASTLGSAVYGAHLPRQTIESIIHHAAEGVGVRATARLLNLSKDTVNNVIFRVGLQCAQLLDSMMKSLSLQEVQFDELWSFVKKNGL